ncbi:MAG: hypothetical protein HQL05_07640 [Nitrospirae bacterium]|nr:hypothetical protein [Nitrospirota bacterium]
MDRNESSKTMCNDGRCWFKYRDDLPKEIRLALSIKASGKTNVFVSDKIDKPISVLLQYSMTLMDNGRTTISLNYDRSFNTYKAFMTAFIVTLVTELLCWYICLLFLKKSGRVVLISVMVANCISLPVLWSAFSIMNNLMPYLFFLILSEFLVLFFEVSFISYFNRGHIRIKEAALVTVGANISSFLSGIVLFGYLPQWISL